MFLVIYVKKKIMIFNFNMDNEDKTSCVKNVKSHQRVLNFRSQSWPFVAANGIFKLSKSGVLHFHDKMQIHGLTHTQEQTRFCILQQK